MKKFISIAFISLSSLVLLALAIVPHHHHKGLACMIMEICDEDNNINDEHTSHNNIPFDSNQSETCVADSEYTTPQSNRENQCKVTSCTDNLVFDADAIGSFADAIGSFADYGEYIVFYTSAEANHFNGLRAPPIHV